MPSDSSKITSAKERDFVTFLIDKQLMFEVRTLSEVEQQPTLKNETISSSFL